MSFVKDILTFLYLHRKHIHLLHPFLQLILRRRGHRIHVVIPPVVVFIRERAVHLRRHKHNSWLKLFSRSITDNNTQLFINFHNFTLRLLIVCISKMRPLPRSQVSISVIAQTVDISLKPKHQSCNQLLYSLAKEVLPLCYNISPVKAALVC